MLVRAASCEPAASGAQRRRWLALVRPAVGLAVLAVLAARLGSGPFLAALRSVDAVSVAVALAVGAATTACCAWRWSAVATALGIRLPVRTALAACYRSQLVNVATPGGLVGDVLRGVDRGRAAGDTALGLRSVAWERSLGQVVQVALALVVLLALPSPLAGPLLVGGVVVVGLGVFVVVLVRRGRRGPRTPGRWALECRQVLSRKVLPRVLAASALVVLGLGTLFLVAARNVGVTAPTTALVPLTLVVLLGAAVPANLAGWGPREGVAAWAFGAAGLEAGQGLATAVVFGVLVLVASLPGAFLLLPRTRPLGREAGRG